MISQEVLFDNAVIGKTPEVLNEIHIEDTNIAIYQREVSFLKKEAEELVN